METLKEIHRIALAELNKRFSLNTVSLKYPFPERSPRTLGLVKSDGDVLSSEKFSRVVLMRINLPVYLSVRSIFLRPRMELDLPVFSCETVITGKKRMFLVDIHRTGESTGHDDSALFDKLIKIRGRYPDLLKNKKTQQGKIQSVFSKAVCQVKIREDLDEQAISIFREYLGVFSEMVEKSTPLSGEALDKAQHAFEGYLKTVVDHDPGVKGYKILFGEKGGVTRALDIFFDR
ncbi:MAG: hypothetical protein JRC57_07595 [Deltaproteobacteria bacterium]|nr:hypothetical protein [Deltaproteobacteria bacterium]